MGILALQGGEGVKFVVGDGFGGVEATRIRTSFSGDGAIGSTEPQFFDRTRDETAITFAGEWTGDTEMFEGATFGEYIVELIVDGTSLGQTGSRVFGAGYHWRYAQTDTSFFVTRHAGVADDVAVSMFVDQSHISGTHRPEDSVIEFDLTEIDEVSGRHDWGVEIHEPTDQHIYHIYLSLRSGPAPQVEIP